MIFMPGYSKDAFLFPFAFRFVRNGTATYTGGAIKNIDYVSFEILWFRILIGKVRVK